MKKKIVEASMGKRFLAYAIDAIVVVVVAMILFSSVTSTKLVNAIGGQQLFDEAVDFQVSSGMFEKSASGQAAYKTYFADPKRISSSEQGPTSQTGYGYEYYFDLTYNYYTKWLPGDHSEDPYKIDDVKYTENGVEYTKTAAEFYTWEFFCEKIMGLPKVSSITDFSDEENYSVSYYSYALTDDGDAVDTTKRPVIRSGYQALIDDGNIETIRNITNDFYDQTNNSGKFYNAATTVTVQSYYQERAKQYSTLSWVGILVAFLPIHTIVFLLLPVLTKKGQTLGKLVAGVGVISADGYSMKWWQRLLHPGLVWLEGCLILIPSTSLALIFFIIVALADYMVAVFSRSHHNQSLHDRASSTMVISTKQSEWFNSYEEEERYYMDHPDEMPMDEEDPIQADYNSYDSGILDLAAVERAQAEREAALRITNFDEFEKQKGDEFDRMAAEEAQAKEALDNPEPTPEETKEEPEPEAKEEPTPEEKEDVPPNEDGFTDD